MTPDSDPDLENEEAVDLPDRVYTSSPILDWLRRVYERGYRDA